MKSRGHRLRSQSLSEEPTRAKPTSQSTHGDLTKHLRKLNVASVAALDAESLHAQLQQSEKRNHGTEHISIDDFKQFLEVSRETARVKQKAPKNTSKREQSFTIGLNTSSHLLGSLSMNDLRAPRRNKKKHSKKPKDKAKEKPIDKPQVTFRTGFDIDAPREALHKMEATMSRSHRTLDTYVGNEGWDRIDRILMDNKSMDSSTALSTSDILPKETVAALRKVEKVEKRDSKKSIQDYKASLSPKSESKSKANLRPKTLSRSNITSPRDSGSSRSQPRSVVASPRDSGSGRSQPRSVVTRERRSGSSRSQSRSVATIREIHSGSTRRPNLPNNRGSGSKSPPRFDVTRERRSGSKSPRRPTLPNKRGSGRSRGKLSPKSPKSRQAKKVDKAVFEMFNWSSNALDLEEEASKPNSEGNRRNGSLSTITDKHASMPSLQDFGSSDFSLPQSNTTFASARDLPCD